MYYQLRHIICIIFNYVFMHCILYCIALYYIVSYCIVMHCIVLLYCIVLYHESHTLKTPGSEIDPERVQCVQTPFRVNDDPEISQLDAECDPELVQSDPIICHVCRKLTNFRVIFDPEWSLAPMDPFPGHAQCDPELVQSDPIICHVCRKLTNFRVIFDPEWSLAPMDPFPGHAHQGLGLHHAHQGQGLQSSNP